MTLVLAERSHQDAGDPSPAARRKCILQCTQAAHGLPPALAQTRELNDPHPEYIVHEHIWCAQDSFCHSIYISEAGRPPVPTASISCLAAICKLPLFQCLELLVLLHMHEPQNQCQERDHEAYDSICRASWYVSWGGCSWVHIRAVNGGRVADHICDGDRDGALDEGPWERVGYPGNNDLVCSRIMICQIPLYHLLIGIAAYAG